MIESVLKAFRVMDLFSYERPRLTLAEISRAMGIPKSTAHNLLNTLKSIGMIEKLDDDTYALGLGLLPMTQYLRVNVEIRDRAAPLLRNLADACVESVYLAVLDRNGCRFIYVIETSRRLQARSALGGVSPLHSSGIGKAMLSFLPDDTAQRILSETGLPRFTANTIVEMPRLAEEIALIRARGFSTDHSENEERTYCIGAPIFDERGNTIAACSLAGIDPEIVGEKLPHLSPCVLFTAQEISRRMGFVPHKVSHFESVSLDPLGDYRRIRKAGA